MTMLGPVRVEDTGGLGPIEVELASGGGPITPASRVTVRAVGRMAGLLSGTGIDWGAGTGLLAIAASRIPAVERVVAVERELDAVANARRNVRRHGAKAKVTVIAADLFDPVDPADREVIEELEGAVDFLVANPPASDDGDGLGWRRRVLTEGLRFLKSGAAVLLQVSAHYGEDRIAGLATDGYRFVETVTRSDWVPFDLGRPDLRRALDVYAAEERRGGPPFRFRTPDGSEVSATQVLEGAGPPLTSWQVHRFERSIS